MKVWITKYALSRGIVELEVERNNEYPSMVSRKTAWVTQCFHGEGRDWHATRESAEYKAEVMRLKRISSLEKQIRKLKALNFKEGGAK